MYVSITSAVEDCAMPICPECNISVDPEWTICPTCSVSLQSDGKQSRRPVSRDERYASNLAWYYHLIPIVTGVLTLAAGDYLVRESDPLLRTIFPPFCLIVGGWLGLILLGIISSYMETVSYTHLTLPTTLSV